MNSVILVHFSKFRRYRISINCMNSFSKETLSLKVCSNKQNTVRATLMVVVAAFCLFVYVFGSLLTQSHDHLSLIIFSLIKPNTKKWQTPAGYSEDSDYTSDLNYPVGQNANSSASQYRNLQTPQRSLETSRENSYEKDDRSFYDAYSTDIKHNMTVSLFNLHVHMHLHW